MTQTTISQFQDTEEWTTIIEPQAKWYDLRLGEIWQYRELVWIFVRRDFVAKYKQTVLGPVWHIIEPLIRTIVFTIVFGGIAGLPTDDLPPFLFYMAGNLIWGYFATSTSMASMTFISNSGLFGKVYFPRLVIPIANLTTNMIAFGLQFLSFIFFLVLYLFRGTPIEPNIWMVAAPLLLLLMAVLSLGLGMIVSAFTTRYRDLVFLVGFGISLLMYACPVIYPISAVPDRFRWIVLMNPVTPIIETFRYGFLGAGGVELGYLIYSVVISIIIFITGLLVFNRAERTFMDTV